jgi:hypothetical protein
MKKTAGSRRSGSLVTFVRTSRIEEHHDLTVGRKVGVVFGAEIIRELRQFRLLRRGSD